MFTNKITLNEPKTSIGFCFGFEEPLVEMVYALIVEIWSHVNASF